MKLCFVKLHLEPCTSKTNSPGLAEQKEEGVMKEVENS